jgi:hypothetical protein
MGLRLTGGAIQLIVAVGPASSVTDSIGIKLGVEAARIAVVVE